MQHPTTITPELEDALAGIREHQDLLGDMLLFAQQTSSISSEDWASSQSAIDAFWRLKAAIGTAEPVVIDGCRFGTNAAK